VPGFSGQIAGAPVEPSVKDKARVSSGSADYNCLGTPMHAVGSGTRRQSGMCQLGVQTALPVHCVSPGAREEAQFVFTGSSARKLRRGRDINLLPGRLVALRLDPLTTASGLTSMRASRHSCYRYSESEAF